MGLGMLLYVPNLIGNYAFNVINLDHSHLFVNCKLLYAAPFQRLWKGNKELELIIYISGLSVRNIE